MASLNGDTGVYPQYAHARIRSILRKAAGTATPQAHPAVPLEPAERALGLLVDEFGETLAMVGATFEPHRMCHYLSGLASAFTTFYEHCPVLQAPSPEVVANRLLLWTVTAETLRTGLELLGIATPERLREPQRADGTQVSRTSRL